ncbi:NAD(P)H-dependent oxidoreductase [Sciscionella sediminilitoris]|uniref:NAD(P)H-dependent oxidoreductase n=1 Tax=Sciscionella sediminilitoris TaxID=1445613 RepID=UPI00068B7364|nr:NAD(P)H-dependent oxidoreductase [Sciscionella sp. SE31]
MRLTLLAGAPAPASAPAVLFDRLALVLGELGHTVTVVSARELPTVALLGGQTGAPELAAAIRAVTRADALVVAAHIHRAGYSGLVQSVLELLPRNALAGKPVLPVATGGVQGRVVALEYALRPLLAARGAGRLLEGTFVEETGVLTVDGRVRESAEAAVRGAAGRLTAELAARANRGRDLSA